MTPPEADVILARRGGMYAERRKVVGHLRERGNAWRELRTSTAVQIANVLHDEAEKIERGLP